SEGVLSQVLRGKVPLDEPEGVRTDNNCIWCRQSLEARRHVGGCTQGQIFLATAATDLAYHHQSGVDTEAHREPYPVTLLQVRVNCLHGSDNPEPGAYGALGIVFMGLGIAKVDQKTIAEILGNVPVEALDDLRAGGLVGAHDLTQILGVELAGEAGG